MEIHLYFFKCVLVIMDRFGFRIYKRNCQILTPTVKFLGVELDVRGFSVIPEERQDLLANVRTPRSLSELHYRVCQFIYSANHIGQLYNFGFPASQGT